MAVVANLKITKIAISQQQFDRCSRKFGVVMQNGPLNLSVKTFEFQKSKMVDGRHFKNR